MGFKYQISHALDSPERTLYHGKIIREKLFLRKLYRQWYAHFLEILEDLPNNVFVELGSGARFLKDL